MTNLELLEDRLERLSQRQQHLAQLLLTTLQPNQRQQIIDEQTIVTNEIHHAHKQIDYAQRGYKVRNDR